MVRWSNDVDGTSPPHYHHLTGANEKSARLETEAPSMQHLFADTGCTCASGKCFLGKCACRNRGTADYKHSKLDNTRAAGADQGLCQSLSTWMLLSHSCMGADVSSSLVVCSDLFECNEQCGCGPHCSNRVLQEHSVTGQGRGNPKLNLRLQMTSNGCGWGLFSMAGGKKGMLLEEYKARLH